MNELEGGMLAVRSKRANAATVNFSDTEKPPVPEWYLFPPKDYMEAFIMTREKYKKEDVLSKASLRGRNKKKDPFSVNIIQFVEVGSAPSERTAEKFGKMASLSKGDYQTIKGLKEIQSYVSGAE